MRQANEGLVGPRRIDPEDKNLKHELRSPGFHHKVGGDGALLVESEDDMRRRGTANPADGDALALTFAVPVAPPGSDYREEFKPGRVYGSVRWMR